MISRKSVTDSLPAGLALTTWLRKGAAGRRHPFKNKNPQDIDLTGFAI